MTEHRLASTAMRLHAIVYQAHARALAGGSEAELRRALAVAADDCQRGACARCSDRRWCFQRDRLFAANLWFCLLASASRIELYAATRPSANDEALFQALQLGLCPELCGSATV